MRHLFLILALTFCTLFVFGQNTFNVSGTLSFEDGTPATGIFIEILSVDAAGNQAV